MRKPSQSVLFGVLLAAIFVSWAVSSPALGQSSSSSAPSTRQQQPQAQGSQTPQGQNGQQGQPQDPNSPPQSGPIPISSPQPPPPPPSPQPADTPAPAKQPSSSSTPGSDQPVPQQQTVHPRNAKEDVDAIGNRNPGKGVNFYSLEHEIALGKQLAQEVERTSKMIDDPVVTEYVNRVGQNLVRNSDARVPFTIKVIDSDEVNAFALPGGFFYVNSGLILRAQEESELAGVMAHEISHVVARHGTKQATKGEMMQLATIPLILLGPGGWAGYGIYEALQLAIPLSYLKFSRDAEREADFLGIQYMYKAGYDPNAFAAFFGKVLEEERRQPGSVNEIFADHPPTPDRIIKAEEEIKSLPPREHYLLSTSEFDDVKARVNTVLASLKKNEKPGPSMEKPPDKPSTQTPSGDQGADKPPVLQRKD